MPERSMPERTLDTWVASAICSYFPDARIWDPTQAMKGRNWDRAFRPLEAGKAFIFEDNGTTAVTRARTRPLQTHRIEIDAAQLNWYCDKVEPASAIPVYNVLPRPPWIGSTGSEHVPEQAACRVTSDVGPFPHWAYVTRCTDLRRELLDRHRRSIDTDQLPLSGSTTLAQFLEDVREGKAGKWLLPDDKDAVWPRSPNRPTAGPVRTSQDPHAGSALAVFVPAGNLASKDS